MKFAVVRSPSPYNIILGRSGIKELRAIPSIIHAMMKFPTPRGVATLVTRSVIISECRRLEEKFLLKKETEVEITPVTAGEYLGLTGDRVNGVELIACGLARHYSLSEKLPQVEECLKNLRTDDPSVIESSLKKYSDLDYPDNSSVIRSHDIVEQINEALVVDDDKVSHLGERWFWKGHRQYVGHRKIVTMSKTFNGQPQPRTKRRDKDVITFPVPE
ncbi:ATP-dependent caseinolytic (Clp) protease/crotonase family protein [Artemisia annua]|uniref:3-hydroxyisobutyryl-CoA hydrolase n=1 Tax=Artemisia annua TaxID=35608 RepID=A0A2U1Q739_ARTAN|nr:ATP-dependent caseinolytic (Clp) protease/crotonase family protein [Artemisia annua]